LEPDFKAVRYDEKANFVERLNGIWQGFVKGFKGLQQILCLVYFTILFSNQILTLGNETADDFHMFYLLLFYCCRPECKRIQ
jgi:hypothetical protein